MLSDRDSNYTWGPIPSLLLTSAVQHHLLRRHTRTQISMVVEAGDVREIHHVALLIAYGAAAVNPYLAFESVEDLSRKGYLNVDAETAVKNLTNALSTGVLKIMAKMGVSTIMSYYVAHSCFEAIGLNKDVIDEYFTGTTSRVGGVGLDELAEEVAIRHRVAYPSQWTARPHRNLRFSAANTRQWPLRSGEEPPPQRP
ncbi:MAG: glutamate synthase central domain-containing protein [Bifidobacterium pseudocatenulatum]